LVTAPLIGWFFGDMRVVPLLQVMCIVFSINGFSNIGVIYFRKDLKFNKQFILDVSCSLVSLATGIFLAYQLRSVWALVLAELARVTMRCALSYAVHPYRPSLNLDSKRAKKMLNYGKWVLASNIAIYGGSQLDNLMVGKILGTSALGIYSIAYNLSLFSIAEVTYTISEIAFPGYVQLQDDQNRLKRGFDRIFQLSTFLSIPACIGIAVSAPVLINILLGDKWQGVIIPLQILMFAQLIKSIVSTGSPLFLGVGKPNYEFRIQLARTISLFIILYPLIHWLNLPGAASAVVVSAVVMLFQFLLTIVEVSGFKVIDLSKRLLPSLISSTIMAFYVMQAIDYINITNKIVAVIQLSLVISTGALIYLLFFYFIVKRLHCITVLEDFKILFKQFSAQNTTKD
jgi:O-antigen/teichoic acid export membrane protein